MAAAVLATVVVRTVADVAGPALVVGPVLAVAAAAVRAGPPVVRLVVDAKLVVRLVVGAVDLS